MSCVCSAAIIFLGASKPLTGKGDPGRFNFTYDASNDAFIAPKPYNSWTLNNTTYLWEAPITKPDDGQPYVWDETLYQSDNSKGWVEI